MNWIAGTGILIIVIYLIRHQIKKRKHLMLKKHLENSWGKVKEDDYYNFDVINRYFQNSVNKDNAFHVISDQTKDDLDLHDLFKYLDRTSSKIGQQYLYYKLRVVERKDKLLKFDQLTQVFEGNPELRLNCQIQLSRLGDNSTYDLERLINDDPIKKPSYHKFLIPLSLGYIVSFCLGFFNPVFFLALLPIFMVNMVFHYKTKSHISYYLSAVAELNKSLGVAEKIASHSEIKNQFTTLQFIKKIKEIRLKTMFVSFEKQLNNEFAFAFWFISELLKIQLNFEAIIFFSFIDDIIKKRKSIDSLFQFLGEVDSAISVASLKHENDQICKPSFRENKEMGIVSIVHPLIDDCISNDVNLRNKSLLLTGSNMSGKTTFIRAVALSCITSQTINIAFAKEFSIPFFKVYSSIRITDDLKDGASYYLKEVLTVKTLIDVSQQADPCLFVLDEIFKGTNTIERISGGKAILSYLNTEKDLVFVSTHDIELAELLKDDAFELFHFSEQIMDNELFFDHRLKRGKLETRNAIKILDLYDYPKEIIAAAKKTEKDVFS